jgi:hypothetical protein
MGRDDAHANAVYLGWDFDPRPVSFASQAGNSTAEANVASQVPAVAWLHVLVGIASDNLLHFR